MLKTIVCGASGALGAAIVEVLLRRGDTVAGLDLTPPKHALTKHFSMDLCDRGSVSRAVDQAVADMDGLDTLIQTAGIMTRAAVMDLTDDALFAHLNANVAGTLRVCQAATKHMLQRGGSIVLVTSIHGQVGVPGRAAYAASKGAIASLGRVMAAELAPHDIRVNMLAPGPIDGGMAAPAQTRNAWIAASPSQRVASLNEVARAAAMMTSGDASFINGQTIAIDGGVSTLCMTDQTPVLA